MSLLDNLSRDCITRTVDPIGLKHTFAVAATQPVVQHAIDIIDRYMWTDGIEIHYNNKPMELTPYFRNHLETHWKSLVKDILVWILCTGVLPVTFKILPDGTWVPKIVKPGGGHINSVYRDNVQHFTYVRYGEYYPDEETIVLHGFGYDPTIDGALTSPISSLSLQQTCIRIFLDAAAEAEKIRCNPTLVLQMRKDNTEREQVYGVDYGYYAEADVSSERAKLMTYNKDLARAERVGYLNDSKKTRKHGRY